MNKKQSLEINRQARCAELRKLLKPGDTVYTALKHVSRSGMYRVIDTYVMKDNIPLRISWSVAEVTGFGYDKRHEGVKASGCGMDMGFEIVYNLSYALYPAGFGCIGKGCPAADHTNGDRDYTPHVDGTPRTSEEVETNIPAKRAHTHYHKDGGYALKHSWL
jgi:hypothetical protein